MCMSSRNLNEVDFINILKKYNMDLETFEKLKVGDFSSENTNDELEDKITTPETT